VTCRQTMPEQWLIVNDTIDPCGWRALRKLARGSGVLVLNRLKVSESRRLRNLARARALTIVIEAPRATSRVHNARELRNALLRRAPMILLSPMWPTRSHPDWKPLPRMRAAALAQLGHRKLVALGGMNARRYAKIAPLGFIGWAGISAFRT
jgi:thiamine-phosphate pyrophosphorylase